MSRYFTNLAEAETYLLAYSPEKQSGETYTLDRMKQLMERLGNPQNDIKGIHIAGTSGKTSTAYFIRAILEAHGKKTGLTTSPHISSITERIQISGQPIEAEKFMDYLRELIDTLLTMPDMQPTYFELLIALAFWVFKKEQVDYAVVEVGLGGLLDGTNVMSGSEKISVITPIGLDHTEILGNTIEQIASQKAGIINQNSIVFTGQQYPNAMKVIEHECEHKESRLVKVDSTANRLEQAPLFQQRNFTLASDVVTYIAERDGFTLSALDMANYIHQTPPGRFEVYSVGSKTIVMDGAHNPQKLDAFVEALSMLYPAQQATWILGIVNSPDSKLESCIGAVARAKGDYIFTEFTVGQDIKGRKSVAANTLLAIAARKQLKARVQVDYSQALNEALQTDSPIVIITGSLYLVAKLRDTIRQLAVD